MWISQGDSGAGHLVHHSMTSVSPGNVIVKGMAVKLVKLPLCRGFDLFLGLAKSGKAKQRIVIRGTGSGSDFQP